MSCRCVAGAAGAAGCSPVLPVEPQEPGRHVGALPMPLRWPWVPHDSGLGRVMGLASP